MGFIFETNESDNVVNRLPTINNKKEKSFIENFSAAYNFSEYNNTSISESLVLQEEWQPIVDLIKHLNQDVKVILKQYGYDLAPQHNYSSMNGTSSNVPKGGAKSFSRQQMVELYKQASIKVKYADNFLVLRFPDGHFIKQKYAPFTLNTDGSWSMKRPEGTLPIYIEEKHLDKPVIINEGENILLINL